MSGFSLEFHQSDGDLLIFMGIHLVDFGNGWDSGRHAYMCEYIIYIYNTYTTPLAMGGYLRGYIMSFMFNL